MSSSRVHVAIIDEGVVPTAVPFNLLNHIEITADLKARKLDHAQVIPNSHGTLCAAIVHSYFRDAAISSVRILDHSRGKAEQLYAALKWCLDHQVRVVNISLGSQHFRDRLPMSRIINEMAYRGLIMVCAGQNDGMIAYPASLSNTIGVKSDPGGSLKQGEYLFHDGPEDGIDISAYSEHWLSLSSGQRVQCPPFNSFAAPLITAKVCEIISESPACGINEVKIRLRERAARKEQNAGQGLLLNGGYPDWIGRAIIFSVEQERLSTQAPYWFSVANELQSTKEEVVAAAGKEAEDRSNSDVDTWVIKDGGNLKPFYLPDLLKLAQKHGKNLIYSGDGGLQPRLLVQGAAYRSFIKYWDSGWTEQRLRKYGIKEGVDVAPQPLPDVPFVQVVADRTMDMLNCLYGVQQTFAAEGYHAWICVDDSSAALHGFHYFPIYLLREKSTQVAAYLAEYIHRASVDIVVFGLYRESPVQCESDQAFEPDIRLDIGPDKVTLAAEGKIMRLPPLEEGVADIKRIYNGLKQWLVDPD